MGLVKFILCICCGNLFVTHIYSLQQASLILQKIFYDIITKLASDMGIKKKKEELVNKIKSCMRDLGFSFAIQEIFSWFFFVLKVLDHPNHNYIFM